MKCLRLTKKIACATQREAPLVTSSTILYTSIVKVDLYNMKCLRLTKKIACVTEREAPLATCITTLRVDLGDNTGRSREKSLLKYIMMCNKLSTSVQRKVC
jgi:hypothetical protein